MDTFIFSCASSSSSSSSSSPADCYVYICDVLVYGGYVVKSSITWRGRERIHWMHPSSDNWAVARRKNFLLHFTAHFSPCLPLGPQILSLLRYFSFFFFTSPLSVQYSASATVWYTWSYFVWASCPAVPCNQWSSATSCILSSLILITCYLWFFLTKSHLFTCNWSVCQLQVANASSLSLACMLLDQLYTLQLWPFLRFKRSSSSSTLIHHTHK